MFFGWCISAQIILTGTAWLRIFYTIVLILSLVVPAMAGAHTSYAQNDVGHHSNTQAIHHALAEDANCCAVEASEDALVEDGEHYPKADLVFECCLSICGFYSVSCQTVSTLLSISDKDKLDLVAQVRGGPVAEGPYRPPEA